MVRSIGCGTICLILAAIGCNRPSNGVDPFLGRTTIAAPGTGSPGDTYYPGTSPVYPQPATTPPTVQFPPAGTAPPSLPSTGTPNLQQPPGGFQPPPANYYRNSSHNVPTNATPQLSEVSGETPPRLRPVPEFDTTPLSSNPPPQTAPSLSKSVVTIDGSTSHPVVSVAHNRQGQPPALASNVRVPTPSLNHQPNGTPVMAVAQPTPAPPQVTVASSTLTGPVMRRAAATTDLADLPPVHASAIASTAPANNAGSPWGVSTSSMASKPSVPDTRPATANAFARAEANGNVSLASYEQPVVEAPRAANFGHAADYSWLKGRLEYSAARQEWKLRYLRIDGEQTDNYGGSVVLVGGPLQSVQPGQYVTVQGQLDTATVASGTFAPAYRVSNIGPQ